MLITFAFLCLNLCGQLMTIAAKALLIGIKYQLLLALLGNTYAVALKLHGRHVEYEDQVVLAIL